MSNLLCQICSDQIKKHDDYVSRVVGASGIESAYRYHLHLQCLENSTKRTATKHGTRRKAKRIMSEFNVNDIDNPLMPFGKYGPKGTEGHTRIQDIPDDYMIWLVEKAESGGLNPKWLNKTILLEWQRRSESLGIVKDKPIKDDSSDGYDY